MPRHKQRTALLRRHGRKRRVIAPKEPGIVKPALDRIVKPALDNEDKEMHEVMHAACNTNTNSNTVMNVIEEVDSLHEAPDSDAELCNYAPVLRSTSSSGGICTDDDAGNTIRPSPSRPTPAPPRTSPPIPSRRRSSRHSSRPKPSTSSRTVGPSDDDDDVPARPTPHPSSPGVLQLSPPLSAEESDYEVPEGHIDLFDANLSATHRKFTLQEILETQGDAIDLPPPVKPPQYGFIAIDCLNDTIQGSLCSECYAPALKFTYELPQGLAVKMMLTCQDCGNRQGVGYSSPLLPGVANTQGRRPFDINRRIAFTLRQIGCGQAATSHRPTDMERNGAPDS
jgi:hypothetical protein